MPARESAAHPGIPQGTLTDIVMSSADSKYYSGIAREPGTFGTPDPANPASLRQVDRLRRDGRIDHFGPADYRPGSPTSDWLTLQVERIAAEIAAERKSALKERVGEAPRHLPH